MNNTRPNHSQAAEDYVFKGDWYENEELKTLPRLLKDARVFVDVGASFGPYTLQASKTIQGGEIIAIEANPDSFGRLESSCQQWALDSGNQIRCFHAAAADRAGQIDFFIPNSELPLISGVFQNTNSATEWQKITVDCLTLDETLQGIRPDLIKIDVEGAEYRVLLGAAGILAEGCRFLIEVHPWGDPEFKKTPVDIFQFFYERGYDFQRVSRHWHFYPASPSFRRTFKFHTMAFIQQNAGLKEALKKLVLKVDAWHSQRKS